MVLELLIYAKTAIKNFDQSEASIVVMWLSKEASDWSKFFYCTFGIYDQFQDHFTLGHFLIRALFKKKILRKLTSGAHSTNFFQGSLITF